MTTCVEILAW